jgi:hypothetical protein
MHDDDSTAGTPSISPFAIAIGQPDHADRRIPKKTTTQSKERFLDRRTSREKKQKQVKKKIKYIEKKKKEEKKANLEYNPVIIFS